MHRIRKSLATKQVEIIASSTDYFGICRKRRGEGCFWLWLAVAFYCVKACIGLIVSET